MNKETISLIHTLDDLRKTYVNVNGGISIDDDLNIDKIRKIITEADRNTGKWIPIRNYQGFIVAYKCSKCEKTPRRRVKSDYCPNCGAEMNGGDSE